MPTTKGKPVMLVLSVQEWKALVARIAERNAPEVADTPIGRVVEKIYTIEQRRRVRDGEPS